MSKFFNFWLLGPLVIIPGFLLSVGDVQAQSCSTTGTVVSGCPPAQYDCSYQAHSAYPYTGSEGDVDRLCGTGPQGICKNTDTDSDPSTTNCCEKVDLGGGSFRANCYEYSGAGPQPTTAPSPTPPTGCVYVNPGIACTGGTDFDCGITASGNRFCCSSECPATLPPGVSPGPGEGLGGGAVPDYKPCDGVPGSAKGECESCVEGGGAYTALGCIPTSSGTEFAASIMRILFAMAGGVAFLLMIYGAYICITSRGDPQKAQACRETITSAIVGLLMLIFSLLIISVLFGRFGLFGADLGLEKIFN